MSVPTLAESIESAMTHAPMSPENCQVALSFGDKVVTTNCANYTDIEPEEPIDLNPNPAKPDNAVIVASQEELRQALTLSYRACELPLRDINRVVAHEVEHHKLLQAAYAAAGIPQKDGYVYTPERIYQGVPFFVVAFNRLRGSNPLKTWEVVAATTICARMSKIAAATTYMASVPSGGDLEALRASYGYSPSQLRREVLAHNDITAGAALPVPPHPALVGLRRALRS
jgi:hypothetical protein